MLYLGILKISTILTSMKFHYLIFFIFSTLILFSCKDEPTPTPTPTPIEVEDEWPTFVDTGANLVAYKVDGRIRVCKNISKIDSTQGFLSCGFGLHENPKYFYLIGERISDETYESVTVSVYNLVDTGKYILENFNTTFNLGSFTTGLNENQSKEYTSNEIDTGYVIVTKIDTIKGFITGRFEFTGRYVFGIETKKISEGRFDVKYYR